MLLSKKFVIVLFWSVSSIAVLNIIAFYVLYSIFIAQYLSEKIDARQEVTLEYINNIVERQTLEEVDNIFSESELEFFELLDVWWGKIELNSEKNINTVVDFLVKSGISPKYIEEIIPNNNLEMVLEDLKNPQSPESSLIKRIFIWLSIVNILLLFWVWVLIYFMSRRTFLPIQKITQELEKFRIWEDFHKIEYDKKDEIWLLIRSLNMLNRKLALQESIRTQLVADISHELKTPITSIQCYLEGISDKVISLTPETLASLSSEMQRLIKLVNMILQFQNLENTTKISQKTSFSPYKYIKDVRKNLSVQLESQLQELRIRWSKNIEIYADADLFIQLLYNIFWNFMKYAGTGSILTVVIQSTGIVFSDNGVGIAKSHVPYLFEKFYQWKQEKSEDIEKRGIGVGLSLVKKICELHNWKIYIRTDTDKWFTLEIIF